MAVRAWRFCSHFRRTQADFGVTFAPGVARTNIGTDYTIAYECIKTYRQECNRG
jgi:hypothetical protein